MIIQALGKNIVIKPLVQEKTAGSIILSTKEDPPEYWMVVSVGNHVELEIGSGDTILIGYGLKTMTINDEKIYMIEECNVLAEVIFR